MAAPLLPSGRRAAVALGLAVATVVALWPLFGAAFIAFDDDLYVTSNPRVLAGPTPGGVAWAFTALANGNWHPLTWLSHMVDARIFGLVPAGHHATSLLLHALSAALLFLAIESMTGAAGRAAFVAAVFALHPLHVESVAWIAERKDTLSGLFFMLTLLAYSRYAASRSRAAYAGALGAFAMGLLAKPMIVTAPFVLLLLDFWPLRRLALGSSSSPDRPRSLHDADQAAGNESVAGLLVEKIPFFALMAGSCVITFIAQQSEGAVSGFEKVPLGLRLANMIVSYTAYLGKAFWPHGLAVFYPLSHAPSLPAALVSAAILSAVSLAAVSLRRRCPYLLVGWLWYVGMLVPVIGLVQIGAQAMADRYTYLPLIGISVAVAWGVTELLALRPMGRAWAAPTAVAVVIALALLSRAQAGLWKDSVTLFTHTISVTKDNWLAHGNLGVWYFSQGQTEAAIEQLEEAVRLAPMHQQSRLNLGNALSLAGRPAEAVPQLREAVKLNPSDAAARYNLGAVLVRTGPRDEAESELREAVRLDPTHARAHTNLAGCLLERGRVGEALEHYQRAVSLQPADARFRVNLAIALTRAGRREDAIKELREALRLRPGDPEAEGLLRKMTGAPVARRGG